MLFRDYILAGKARLESARLECADPLLHMKQIVEAALQIDSSQLVQRWDSPMGQGEQDKAEAIVLRRLTGEPFQYIVGYEWFWDHKFQVGKGVLIPRPETERLVELALERLPKGPLTVAELGAGSGILGVTLLKERPWKWRAWENNPDSLPYLKANLALLPVGADYCLQESDFFSGDTRADWWISNPPYVTRSEIPRLSREVQNEPAQALDGGPLGLEIVERLIALAPQRLNPGGGLMLEIGSDQGPQALEMLQRAGFVDARIEKDLAGRDRVAYGRIS